MTGIQFPIKQLILFLGISFLLISCSNDPVIDTTDTDDFRGEIISITMLHDWSIAQTDSALASYDPDLLTYDNNYPLEIYRVVYKTVDAFGNETQASGAVVIPVTYDTPLPLCNYSHGTVVNRYDVPSYESDELILGILFGASGYVMSLPDYLGMGDSPGRHLYCHAKTEATAGVDLLRAAKTIAASRNVLLNNQLFIFGYSQGGHASMALTREIQIEHADEFTITASAPMSGPYDMSGAQTDYVLADEPYGAPYYLPYLMFAYNEVYQMYDSPSDYLNSPYDTILPPLFDGTHESWEIDAVMPSVPKEIIKPEILDDFINNANNPFRVALRDNDLTNWTPTVPIIMYYCGGDELVNYQNSIIAQEKFIANGSSSTSVYQPSPTATHGACAEPCFIFANIWFNSLKE